MESVNIMIDDKFVTLTDEELMEVMGGRINWTGVAEMTGEALMIGEESGAFEYAALLLL